MTPITGNSPNHSSDSLSPQPSDEKAEVKASQKHRGSQSYVSYLAQHSTENRNPYENLVAKIKDLPLVHIHSTKPPSSIVKDRRASLISTESAIHKGEQKIDITLPQIFILAAGDTCAKLGGQNSFISMRTTVSAQTTIPSAPKPPTVHLKTGKSAMSSGVILVDLEITTNYDSKHNIVALKQDKNEIPKLEGDLVTMQFAKPLEQVLAGLNRKPPDYSIVNESNIQNTGILELKVNSSDSNLPDAIYRLNLNDQANLTAPLSIEAHRASSVATPTWWSEEKFGKFDNVVKSGYPLEYKKPGESEFKPLEVYGRDDGVGNKLPITGDQDIFCIPRSEKYNFGSAATNVIDTHTPNGIKQLVAGLVDVHKKIVMTELMNSPDLTIEQKAERLEQEPDRFETFLNQSEKYIEGLGTITAYEAYFILELNNRVAELTQELSDKPEILAERIKNIRVDSSIGLRGMQAADIDLHPAWYKEDPENCSKRTERQLEYGKHVSPEILLLHMQYLEKKLEHPTIGLQYLVAQNTSPAMIRSSRERPQVFHEESELIQKMKSQLNDIASQNPEWQIVVKNNNNQLIQIDNAHPIEKFGKISDILIVTQDENSQKNVVHINENKVDSTAHQNAGFGHIQTILNAAKIEINSNFLPQSKLGNLAEAKATMEIALSQTPHENHEPSSPMAIRLNH